jgi:hypothetical protein
MLCYYAVCRILFTILLNVIMLSVITLNVVVLSVVMLSVVAPSKQFLKDLNLIFRLKLNIEYFVYF